MRTPETRETIIYGGAFNPPTLAHEMILQACVDHARETGAEVWVMPSGNRADKTIPVERSTRLGYIAAMLDDLNTDGVPVQVITNELDRTVAVETFDTVVELQDHNPDRELVWVFGADSTETMGEWKNGDWLLENIRMLVIEREGSTINPLAKRALAMTVITPPISSTNVRERLIIGEPIDEYVGSSVAALLAYQ